MFDTGHKVELKNGKTWGVSGATSLSCLRYVEVNTPHVLIPLNQIEGMNADEIGKIVINLFDEANYAQAFEFSRHILSAPENDYWDKHENEFYEIINISEYYIDKYKHKHELINAAAEFINDFLNKIEKRKEKKTHISKEKIKSSTYRDKNLVKLGSKYGFQCLKCKTCYDLEIDHIIPLSQGGFTDINNLQILCKTCNLEKFDKTIDYRPKEKELPQIAQQ